MTKQSTRPACQIRRPDHISRARPRGMRTVAARAQAQERAPQRSRHVMPDMSVLVSAPAPVPKFPLEVLGPRWAGWIQETAAAAVCPPDYVVAALLPTASAIIGNARWAQAWP